MTLQKIYPHLHRLADHEVSALRVILNAITDSPTHLVFNNIPSTLNSREFGLPYKTIFLYLVGLSRRFTEMPQNHGDRTELTREIKQLIARLDNLHVEKDRSSKDTTSSVNEIRCEQPDESLRDGIRMVYKVSVGRYPVEDEINIWLKNFQEGVRFDQFFLGMLSSDEAKQRAESKGMLLSFLNDGEFVQTAYEILLGRCAKAWEIDKLREQLENAYLTREEVLAAIFISAQQIQAELANAAPHDGLSCLVMGTGSHVSIRDWEFKAKTLVNQRSKVNNKCVSKYAYNPTIKSKPQILVSALASLYRGGEFIDQFMDNITGQYGFAECCELIIVDADSPEDEYETIKRYLSKFKNINYIRCNYRIGIYEAWNVAAKAAQGKYLTNTNLDDLRRYDSLMLQAAVLENLKFVDVVYQDFFYTFDPRLSFDEIAAFGLQTTLPVITPHNMLDYNSPHNAPMWRKSLHEELGYFETRYRSAGDYEFWMRCLAAGKKFFKINEPHVIYYQNPKGLSTRPDTRGLAESCDILKTYGRKLVSDDVVMPRGKLIDSLIKRSGGSIEDVGDRYHLAQQSLRNLARNKKYSSQPRTGLCK